MQRATLLNWLWFLAVWGLALCKAPAEETPKPPAPEPEPDSGFIHGFLIAFAMILVSELGDKTFIIAAIMAMKEKRHVVFLSSFAALALMTVLSVLFGLVLPQLLSRSVTNFFAAVLFFVFGAKMLKEAYSWHENRTHEEIEQVKTEIDSAGTHAASNMESAASPVEDSNSSLISIRNKINPLFIQVFTLTFLAEWGDRSQIATIALGASNGVFPVMLGACLGHFVCSLIAVLGGQFLASRISVRKVTMFGGVLFIVFALWSLIEATL